MMKKKFLVSVILISLCLFGFFFIAPAVVESLYNSRLNEPPYIVAQQANELHKKLSVADLHADSLLWDRDILKKSSRGHVDIPRLIEGGVALQAFTIVTKSPRGLNYESNDGNNFDNVTPLIIAERWPMRTWNSLTERALYQAAKFNNAAERSQGALVGLRTRYDLARYLDQRNTQGAARVAGFLGVEGAHALDGDLANVDRLFDAGVRMIAPTHFFDNDLGGSAHGLTKGGLTEKGRELIRRLEERRIIVDLAHASEKTIDDVLKIATRPVVVSHTGVKATCDNRRNLSDDQLKRIAATGGLIGIGFWETATCGKDASAIARAMKHVARLVGPQHVALGSDFDGTVTVPFDASGVALITEALLVEGFTEEQIKNVMGGNVVRFLLETLPE